MPLLKIAQGPWSPLMQGSIQDRLLEVYVNPKKWIYVQIIESVEGKFKTLIAEFYKPYYTSGEISSFVQTLPRELLVLSKHRKDDTQTFLILGSGAVNIPYEEELILEQTDILLKQVEVSTNLLREVGKAYDVQLKELSDCDDTISNAFFTLPLLIPTLTTNAHFVSNMEVPVSSTGAIASAPASFAGEIILGTLPTGIQVKEPISFFKKTLITSGRIEHRQKLVQLLAEGALLSNVPVVIFDWNDEFSVMRNANSSAENLRKQKIEMDTLGFSLKEFNVPENVKIDLSMIEPAALAEVMGIAESELGQQLISFLKDKPISSVEEGLRVLRQLTPTENLTAFQMAGLQRVFKLMELMAPHYWEGQNPIEEISKNWFHSIARIGIIKMREVHPLFRGLVAFAITKGIVDFYQKKGVSGKIKSYVVIPEAQTLFTAKKSAFQQAMARLLQEMSTQDVGFLLSVPHDIDIPSELAKNCEAQISIINGSESAVDLAGRKSYRLMVRDSVSMPVSKV